MHIYRPKYRDRDGTLKTARVWWLEYEREGRRHRVSLGIKDRRAAEIKAGELMRKAELRAAGAVDPFEDQRALPLAEHVADLLTSLEAKGVTEHHYNDRRDCLRAFRKATGAASLTDLDGARASGWLTGLRERGLSARSVNRHYAALRQFGRWLARERRVPFDPFVSLAPLNEATDRRRVRRSFTPDELPRLLGASRVRPLTDAKRLRVRSGVSPKLEKKLRRLGWGRALLYATVVGTGLRRGEARQLKRRDLDFEGERVNLPAAVAKARRDEWVPLRSDLARALKDWMGDAPGAALIFPGDVFPTMRTFRKDLEAAGIAYQDEEGRFADFHSLRKTFITGLAVAKVHPKEAQALARHSSIDLTMQVYTDVRLLNLKDAVERLPPAVPAAERAADTSSQAHPRVQATEDPHSVGVSGPDGGSSDLGGNLGDSGVISTDKSALTCSTLPTRNQDLRRGSKGDSSGKTRERRWYAQQDSNLQPLAPEANALSN